jgi:hypothetical protein
MATYGQQYKWNPPRRKKQRYALIERVVDFSKLPQTAGTDDGQEQNLGSTVTTAWALNDILQVMAIRAGQTVLGVQVEIITNSLDSGDRIQIGYGTSPAKWGEYSLYKKASARTTGYRPEGEFHQSGWVYFSSPDTLDIKIRKAALQGKIRLVVHILEDDR